MFILLTSCAVKHLLFQMIKCTVFRLTTPSRVGFSEHINFVLNVLQYWIQYNMLGILVTVTVFPEVVLNRSL